MTNRHFSASRHFGRRSILSSGIATGLALFLPASSLATTEASYSSLDSVTLPNTLFLFTFMLEDIYIDLLVSNTNDCANQLALCHAALNDIYDLAVKLVAEISSHSATTDLARMHYVARSGQQRLQFLTVRDTLVSPQHMQQTLHAFNALNAEVQGAAQKLLPPGPIRLSDDSPSKRLLEQLIEKTRQVHEMLTAAGDANSKYENDYKEKSKALSSAIHNTRQYLLNASAVLSQRVTSQSNVATLSSQGAPSEAVYVAKAVNELKSVIGDKQVSDHDHVVEVLQSLQDYLQKRSGSARINTNSGEGVFRLASNSAANKTWDLGGSGSPGAEAYFSAAADCGTGGPVSLALCESGFAPKPATPIQVSLCTSLFFWIWASPISLDRKSESIAGILNGKTLWQWLGGSLPNDPAKTKAVARRLASVSLL